MKNEIEKLTKKGILTQYTQGVGQKDDRGRNKDYKMQDELGRKKRPHRLEKVSPKRKTKPRLRLKEVGMSMDRVWT